MIEFVMSCAGLGGSVIATGFLLVILRPVYKSMQEDVFLKIGGNGNMWGMLLSLLIYRCLQILYSLQELFKVRHDNLY